MVVQKGALGESVFLSALSRLRFALRTLGGFGDGAEVIERTQNADFRRKLQIFTDSPFPLEIQAFGGRRKPQKTTDSRRKPKNFSGNRRKPQIGLGHLRSVTFSSALQTLEKL